MGHRDAGIGRGCDPGGNARHHLDGDAPIGQVGGFLTAPSEQKRVTPLEAHHHTMLLSHLHQHGIGAGLRHGVMTTALANELPLTPLRHQIQHFLRNQGVVDEGVALAEQTRSLHGEQLRVTGAGAHQINGSGLLRSGHGRAARRSIRT